MNEMKHSLILKILCELSQVYPYSNSDLRPVFKVQLTSDNRFTDDNGQVLGSLPPVSETTYPIPLITGDRLPQDPIQRTVYQPIYRQFVLPNPYLQNPDLSPNTIVQFPPKGCKFLILPIKLDSTVTFSQSKLV